MAAAREPQLYGWRQIIWTCNSLQGKNLVGNPEISRDLRAAIDSARLPRLSHASRLELHFPVLQFRRRQCVVRTISCLIFCFTVGLAALAQDQPREPKGICVMFLLDSVAKSAYTAAYTNQFYGVPDYPSPALTLPPTNDVLINYFTVLLDNPSVSGLAPAIPWNLLSQTNPGPDPLKPAAGSYIWQPLDDLFIAVDNWNSAHPRSTPKTIQLMISPGFNSPPWVFTDIDAGAFAAGCGAGICVGDCDGLFLLDPPSSKPFPNYSNCGYTTIFWEVEGSPQVQEPLPLPWNQTYKNDWKRFLITLNSHLQSEPSAASFVSIAMAGPTSSSTEMILPTAVNQKPLLKATGGFLTLSPNYWGTAPTLAKLTVADGWNILLANNYGKGSKYYNTDGAFIEEWDRAIDLYSGIFSGITLALTTTSDSLPTFPQPEGETAVFTPAAGFASDCDDDPDSNKAMACAAVTQVLAYFVNPGVGGNNAKATQEDGLSARDGQTDLGPNGIKWLAVTTAAGTAPLPGTGDSMSPVIGGLQMGKSFSSQKPEGNGLTVSQLEGCPDYPNPACDVTPSAGFNYVLKNSFFPGTPAAPAYGDSATVAIDHFSYSNAHMNYLQIYNGDFLYAESLGNCTMFDLVGSPDFGVPPSTADCKLKPKNKFFSDAAIAESELEAASSNLLGMAELVP
jgi:hypothetical protein